MIKKPNQGVIKTDEDVYKYYGITDKEIEFIEKIISTQTLPAGAKKKKTRRSEKKGNRKTLRNSKVKHKRKTVRKST